MRFNAPLPGKTRRLGKNFSVYYLKLLSLSRIYYKKHYIVVIIKADAWKKGDGVARKLNISNSTVSRSVERGEKIATDMKLKLTEN